MRSPRIETQQQQLSTMIPTRYRILLYLNIFLIVVDICINTFSEFLAPNKFGQLIIFIIQDVCILLSITLLIVMVLTTYVAQAVFCATIQGLLLGYRFPQTEFVTSAFGKPEILALYVVQRTISPLYYYAMKRAAYRLSDPHFYQSSKWLQDLWEKRRNEATSAAMRTAATARPSGTATGCCSCTIM
ncbi:unnamed protein product [Rotaria socialis]|uniref:Transmembrane protein 138 n=1 Tax=Rotaria socialis TaxID=392032 RepID=A0A817XQS8_9BILA|nr:unnamed protein product [Rotaria socialis]